VVVVKTPTQNVTSKKLTTKTTKSTIRKKTSTTTIAVSSAAALAILSGAFAYFGLIAPPARLRRKLKKVEEILPVESTEILKDQYKGIYGLYLKVSEKHKEKYYSNVSRLREKIEKQLKTEKEVEKLLEETPKLTDLKKQKCSYLKINELYKELQPASQEKFYPKIVHLRELLERKK
jgi:hypothetical protein